MRDLDVAILGAGPTGLTLACELVRQGVSVAVFEKREGPSTLSKALALQARTWEVLDQLGCGDAAREAGQPMTLVELHVDGRPVPPVRFPDPKQRPLVIPQSKTEAILLRRLTELGGSVRWRHTLSGFEAGQDGVRFTVDGPDGRQELQARFLVGCDGAHSVVRKGLGLPFDGDSYHQDFIQIDCRAGGDGLPDDRILVYLDADQALVTMPLGGGLLRAILLRQRRPEGAPEVPEPREFEAVLRAHGRDVTLHDVGWAIRFHLHERMAPRHRVGPVFLAGDAAHIHTPAGGLGMNTGIQDAQNLGWKLAMVVQGRAGEALLESYHQERSPVAADVLATSRGFFTITLGDQWLVKKLRRFVMPRLMGSARMQRRAIGTVSLLGVGARGSPVVAERRGVLAGGPQAGDRAPDGPLGETTLHRVLREGRHLVLFFGPGATEASRAPLDVPGRVLAVEDTGRLVEYRIRGQETCVIRPDGVIGLRSRGHRPEAVRAFFDRYAAPAASAPAAPTRQWTERVGLAISALPGLMLTMSALLKLTQQPQAREIFAHLGYPGDALIPIGAAELICAALYLAPQTAVLGAVLLTGYLGGAIASHVRLAEPFMPPLILAVLVWGGLYLRERRLRALLPWR